MATKVSIAIQRDKAHASLVETGQQIATMLGIEPPSMGMFFKDKDLQQAEELSALAAFNQRVIAALEARLIESVATERITDGSTTRKTQPPALKRNR